MNKSKELLILDRLINLFFIFVIGNTAFILRVFWEIPPAHPWKSGIQQGLFLIGIFSYEVVFMSLIIHYVSKAKETVADLFNQKPQLLYQVIVLVLGITYLILNTILERSWIIFARDAVMVGLIVVAMPFVHKKFEQNHEKHE